MDRADIILLAIAAGLVIVVVVASSSLPTFSREMTKELCEDSDGVWNECGSMCTGEAPGTVCADVCGPSCECKSDFECPPAFYCMTSGAVANETGACRLFFEETSCDVDADCPQPRCLGMHAVCRDGECVTVNEQDALTRCS